MEEVPKIQLPKWLDDLIFKDLGANYCRQNANMTNIDDDKERALNYLGTYFPRSYAEAYSIFGVFFQKYNEHYSRKTELIIFDFGCGTGGEIIGLLTAIEEKLPNIKKVEVVGLDGNTYALHLYDKIITEFKKDTDLRVIGQSNNLKVDDFYDLHILDKVLKKEFDLIISFKAICEFVTKEQFEKKNPYEHIAKFRLPKLSDGGILLLEDVTTYNDVSQEWLPKMMDKGLKSIGCNIILQNDGYNKSYTITHSRKSNDVSKVAWRMIKK